MASADSSRSMCQQQQNECEFLENEKKLKVTLNPVLRILECWTCLRFKDTPVVNPDKFA
jgi:hypothetical protein